MQGEPEKSSESSPDGRGIAPILAAINLPASKDFSINLFTQAHRERIARILTRIRRAR
jgi:hypothetical protein